MAVGNTVGGNQSEIYELILYITFTHILELLIPVLMLFMLMYLLDKIDFLNFSVILSFCSSEYEYSSFLELDALWFVI
jgi:hypothetical protein